MKDDSQLHPSHSCWDKGGMVDGHIHVIHPGTIFGYTEKLAERKETSLSPPQDPGNETVDPVAGERKKAA